MSDTPTVIPAIATPVSAFARLPIGMDDDRKGRIRKANRRLAWVLGAIAGAFMVAATFFYMATVQNGERQALRQLETFNDLRHDAILAFFQTHENEIQVWAENVEFEERAREIFIDWAAMSPAEKRGIREHFVADAPLPSPTPAQAVYLDHYNRITPQLEDFIEHHNFYDLFLFNPGGELAYTVVREDDFGLDYHDPSNPYYTSGLGEVARQAEAFDIHAGEELPTAISDFAPYAPSGNTMEAFIAEPLPYENAGGDTEKLGVLAIQLSFAELNEILEYRSGLKESGRTLLVGADRMIRNNPEKLAQDAHLDLDTKAVNEALAGRTFFGQSTGERDQAVYVAAQPLDFHDLRWAVLTEMDKAEVLGPLRIYLWVYFAALLGIAVTAWLMYQIVRLRR